MATTPPTRDLNGDALLINYCQGAGGDFSSSKNNKWPSIRWLLGSSLVTASCSLAELFMTPNLHADSCPLSLCPSGWSVVLTLGEKRQATVTLAERLMVTDIEVIRRGTWFAVPKYSGTNASQMTHVVYMVKPVGERGGGEGAGESSCSINQADESHCKRDSSAPGSDCPNKWLFVVSSWPDRISGSFVDFV